MSYEGTITTSSILNPSQLIVFYTGLRLAICTIAGTDFRSHFESWRNRSPGRKKSLINGPKIILLIRKSGNSFGKKGNFTKISNITQELKIMCWKQQLKKSQIVHVNCNQSLKWWHWGFSCTCNIYLKPTDQANDLKKSKFCFLNINY